MNFLLFNLSIGVVSFMIGNYKSKFSNIYDTFEEFEDGMNEIESEKIKGTIYNTIDFLMNNVFIGYFIVLLIRSIPVLNIYLLFIEIKELIKLKEEVK